MVLDVKVTIPEDLSKIILRLAETMQATLENQMVSPRVGIARPAIYRPSEPITKEGKKDREVIEKFVESIEPEIQKQAYKMVKEQIHDLLLMGGNRRRILELLKLGKIPKLIRKKEGPRDPLWLQFGDGVEEAIEEIYILG